MTDRDDAPARPQPSLIRTLPGDTKAAMPLPDGRFQPWEEWAWDEISCGRWVFMSAVPEDRRGAEDLDKEAVTNPVQRDENDKIIVTENNEAVVVPREDWPAWQRLSPDFLHLILLHPAWRDSQSRVGVYIVNAFIDGELNLESETIRGDFGLFNCAVAGPINLRSARVGGLLNLNGSLLGGKLSADRLETDGGVFLRGGAVLKDGANLLGARIGGDLACVGSLFEGEFGADGLETGGSIFFSEGSVFSGDVRLLGAKVSRGLYCVGSWFLATFHADRLETGGSVFMRDGASFEGAIDLPGAQISQDLQLSAARVEGKIDLSGARISGELRLDETSVKMLPPTWGDGAYLNLQNTRLGALHGSLDAWRTPAGRFVARDLDGLTFARAGGGAGGDCLEDAGKRALVDWLEKDLEPKGKASNPREYSPSPYRALAAALDAAGQRSKARHIRFAMARREMQSMSGFSPMKYAAWFSGLFIGHGFRLGRGVAWFVIMVLAFAGLGQAMAAGWRLPPPTLASAADYAEWVRFSLSNAVPIVELDSGAKDFLASQFDGDPPAAARWAFFGQRLFGLMLVFLLLAGLTGWAERRGE